jgi:glutamyl-tRNA reductase
MTELRARDADPSVEDAVERIQDRAQAVQEQETARALRRLADRRSLDPAETETIETLAARLTARLVAAPTAALREGDDARAEVAMDIFGREE